MNIEEIRSKRLLYRFQDYYLNKYDNILTIVEKLDVVNSKSIKKLKAIVSNKIDKQIKEIQC